MKSKIKWWWGCTSVISLATVALTTTISATENQFQSKLSEVLTITNDAIDVNDPRLSNQFRKTFSTLDADQLNDLANRTTLVQLILKELITYSDQSATISPIFSTSWTFSQFYYQFSQIQAQVVDPADAISFSYGNQGPFKNLANGELKVKITIGKNLKNQFSFANGEDEVEITFFGFQKQYDWYQRTDASGQSDWNVNNVANDHLVNPYQLPNRHDRTLWNDIKDLQDPQQFVYDYLIKYEHQLGQAINGSNDPDLANQVLTTNLDRDQLIVQKAIEKVNLEPFFASGKIHLQIWIKQSPWRADKLTLLNDQFGTWSGLKTNRIDLWIGGWKKDYSFAMQPNQDQVVNFDSRDVVIDGQTLSDWSADQLATMVSQGDDQILDQALINFSDYLNPDQANKLINTRLRYQEWKTIGTKLNYQVNAIDRWNGTLKLQVYFDPKWTNLHFVEALGSGFKKIDRFNFMIEFNHLKPEQNLIQQANQFNWSWLNQSTISDYFAIDDPNTIDFKKITNVVKTKLINYQPSVQNDFALATNAANANALDRFKISDFKPDWNQGQVQISWQYQVDAKTIFNGIEYLKPSIVKQSFIINGFQTEARQKYHFDVAKDLELDINDFNQTSNQAPIHFATQIDQKWIINNLINFANQAAKPNALFTTDATLQAFNEQLLVANGISLNLSGDQSYLDGKIKLNRNALVGNFNEDVVFHFRIKSLVAKKQFVHIDHLVANDLNLDDLDRNWVLNNLISFSDHQVANPALIVNQSRQGWLTTSFTNLIIEKSYQNRQATIRFQFQDQPDLVSTISGLIANVHWDFNWHLNVDDLIVNYQSGDDLIANLVNFGDDDNLKKQAFLNTNVSRQEFFTTYFQGLVVKERNLYDHYIQFEIKLQGLGAQTIWLQFNRDAINIFDLDPYYQAKGYDPNQIDQAWLESQIDFAGSRINQPSWFRTNLTKAQFQTWFKWKLIANDQSIGALKLELNSQVKFNFDHFQDFATGIEKLNLSLFGFKAGGQFSFENQVNGQLNFNLAQLTNANQLNENFIYDNLITYQSQKPVLGTIATTNLTKAQLQAVTKLVIEINDTSVVLKFNFASALNQQQLDQASITITNLKFLKQPWSQFDLNLIIIISTFALIFAIGTTILGWQIHRVRKQKASAFKHKLKQQNRLL